ncbi:hypothetical protein ACLHDF_02400 [Priestia aryabhattai]
MIQPSYDDVQKVRHELKEIGYQYWLHDMTIYLPGNGGFCL